MWPQRIDGLNVAAHRSGFCSYSVFWAPEELFPSLDSSAETTIVYKDHAPLQCQEQICLWFGFFCFSFPLALRRLSLQKTCLQVFRRKEEGVLFKI